MYAHSVGSMKGGVRECFANPDACDGRRQILPLYRVSAARDGQLTVGKVVRGVSVQTNVRGVRVGDVVSVEGRFRARDAVIVAETVKLHPLRSIKKALGLLSVVLALAFLPFCFRIERGYLVTRG